MENCKNLPVAIQRHHINNGQRVIYMHNGNHREAAMSRAEEMEQFGYAHDPDEKKDLVEGYSVAYEALATGNFTQVQDGTPDVICMGCYAADCAIPIDRRNQLRGSWKVMRKQIHGR